MICLQRLIDSMDAEGIDAFIYPGELEWLQQLFNVSGGPSSSLCAWLL